MPLTKRAALVRALSPRFGECELTHLERSPIDIHEAESQHQAYINCLEDLGCRIIQLPDLPDHPDGIFVEDTAVVFPELAIITRPGAHSRRGETKSAAQTLKSFRRLFHITSPATLDGGDVFVLGKRVLVGLSTRTNEAAVEQLKTMLQPLGYSVESISVNQCLHLKTAFARVDEHHMLINPEWIDPSVFNDMEILEVDPSEPFAANAIRMDSTLIYPNHFPKTRLILEKNGLNLRILDVSELAKAEAGLTCSSVIFDA